MKVFGQRCVNGNQIPDFRVIEMQGIALSHELVSTGPGLLQFKYAAPYEQQSITETPTLLPSYVGFNRPTKNKSPKGVPAPQTETRPRPNRELALQED